MKNKKIKLDGKLKLNKETIAKLNDEQMGEVKGGAFLSIFHCQTHRPNDECCPFAKG